MLLRIDRGLSYVSDDFASGNPEFWNPIPLPGTAFPSRAR